MATILPDDITTAIQNNIERFGKTLDFRALLFRNIASVVAIDADPVGGGFYNTTTGEYSLSEYQWIKRVGFDSSIQGASVADIVAKGTGYSGGDVLTLSGGTSTIVSKLKVLNVEVVSIVVAVVGINYAVGDTVLIDYDLGISGPDTSTAHCQITVDTIDGGGGITGFTIVDGGAHTTVPPNDQFQADTDGIGANAEFTLTYGVKSVEILDIGAYTVTPSNPASVTGGGGSGATFTMTWSKDAWPRTRLEYQDKNSNWIRLFVVVRTGDTTNYDLPFPIFTKKIRLTSLTLTSDVFIAPVLANLYSDTYFDFTVHTGLEVTLEQNTAGFSDEIRLPFTSITLDNSDGRWNKNRVFSLDYFYVDRTATVFRIVKGGTEDIKTYKKSGIRITVEIKFMGPNFEDSDWIILSNFYARKWTVQSVSGESGWIAKTSIETPLLEGETISKIIEEYIIRKNDGELLIQFHKPVEDDEIVTVVNEVVGEIEIFPEVSTANKFLDGNKVLSHCFDGTFLYYAIRDDGTKRLSNGGLGIEIFKQRPGGSDPELLGTIRPILPKTVRVQGVDIGFEALRADTPNSNLNGGIQFTRYTHHVWQMAVDDKYLYIPVCNAWFADYTEIPIQTGKQESCIYKLSKNGGWSDRFGPNFPDGVLLDSTVALPVGIFAKGVPHANYFILSLGYHIDPSPFITLLGDQAENSQRTFMGCEIITNGDGDKKLLVMVKMKNFNDDSSSQLTEYWEIDTDFNPNNVSFNSWGDISIIQKGTSGNRERVICTKQFNDKSFYVFYEDLGETINTLGVLSRDDAGTYAINTTAPATDVPVPPTRIQALSFHADGLYASGRGYSIAGERSSGETSGIVQVFNNAFTLQGYNISHIKSSIFSKFLSHPVPLIKIGAENSSVRITRWGQDKIEGNVYKTLFFELNLSSGDLTIKQIPEAGETSIIRASYDFTLSTSFYKAEGPSRLSSDILGKLQQASQKTFFIDEHGALEKLPFLESQTIPIKYVNDEYTLIKSANPDTNPELEGGFAMVINGLFAADQLFCFQFTPDFDGKLESLTIPLRFIKLETKVKDPLLEFEVWFGNDTSTNVDLSRTGAIDTVAPPVTADLEQLATRSIFANSAKLLPADAIGFERTEYHWYKVDLGSTHIVTKGQSYALIFRQSGDVEIESNNWQVLSKFCIKGSPIGFANRTAFTTLPDGAAMSTLVASTWDCATNNNFVTYCFVNITKTKQELRSINIIDSLNPNISAGFNSIIGGSNSTIAVRSPDFSTLYVKATDYTITFASGKFFINFTTFNIEDSVIIQWYESKVDLLGLSDIPGNKLRHIAESSSHGDDDFFLRTIVKGERSFPSVISAEINKIFDLFPGLGLEVISDNKQTKRVEAVSIADWDEEKGEFVELPTDSLNAEAKTFALDFKDPFLVGTTAYKVREGKGKTTDEVLAGSITPSIFQDVPIFHEVNTSSLSLSDEEYHVMLDNENYLEWRIATIQDFTDMIPAFMSAGSLAPTGLDDVKTINHFYLKHMNRAYGENTVNYIVYESEEILFYLDIDRAVIQDDSFTSESLANPLRTHFAEKRIQVVLLPGDFAGNPLFPAHSEGGAGDDPTMDSAVKKKMAGKIVRNTTSSSGLNIVYDNYGVLSQFLTVQVIGFPVNRVLELKSEVRNPGFEHADAKVLNIENNSLQSQFVVDRLAKSLNNFWSVERLNYDLQILFNPMVRPGTISKITSEHEGLTTDLFVVTNPKHTLSFASGFTSNLSRLLQI